MSREVVHARAPFGKPLGFRVLGGYRRLDPRCAAVAAAAELGGEFCRVYLVAAADAHLRQLRSRLFEENGELLSAHGVELVDRAVGLVRRCTAIAEPSLADRAPDEAVTELVMQPL